MSEKNKAIVHRIIDEMWNKRDTSKLKEFYTESILDEISIHLSELLSAFSDLRVTIEEPGLIAEGDYVAMRLSVAGTHDSGQFAGREPTGKKISWESLRIFKFLGDKIVSTWAIQDRLRLMQQLGAVQTMDSGVHWFSADEK
jgi:predicted ester cyclase